MELMPSVHLGEDDVLVVNLGVGSLPAAKAQEYIEKAQMRFKMVFGDDQPMMIFPVSHTTDVTFTVIHRDSRPARKTFHVDTEGMEPEEVKAYLRSKLQK